MNTTIYATILTGLGIVTTMIITMHTLAKTNQQETNRRIDDLKQDTNRRIDDLKQDINRRIDELRQDLLAAIENKSKVTDAQFEVVGVRFQKLEENVAEVRQEVQDLKKVIFKTAA